MIEDLCLIAYMLTQLRLLDMCEGYAMRTLPASVEAVQE